MKNRVGKTVVSDRALYNQPIDRTGFFNRLSSSVKAKSIVSHVTTLLPSQGVLSKQIPVIKHYGSHQWLKCNLDQGGSSPLVEPTYSTALTDWVENLLKLFKRCYVIRIIVFINQAKNKHFFFIAVIINLMMNNFNPLRASLNHILIKYTRVLSGNGVCMCGNHFALYQLHSFLFLFLTSRLVGSYEWAI